MSEQKRKIGFTVACVNEFANKHNLSAKEAFQYLFQFKGIALIKENYNIRINSLGKNDLSKIDVANKMLEMIKEILKRVLKITQFILLL